MKGKGCQLPLALISCAVFAACTASNAQTAPLQAASSTAAATSELPWPDSYMEGEEGHWTVELTRREIMQGARQQEEYIKAGDRDEHIDMGCIRDYVDAVGFKRTLTWDLYLRDGAWSLWGSVDGKESEPYDGGTYLMPHIELESAVFTSLLPDVRDDLWLYPEMSGNTL